MLFTIVPIVELYILVKAGQHIGTMNTIAIVILTGIAGASFAKSQGAQIIFKIRSALSRGQLPGQELLHGAMILTGGILLITPGFITDVLGFSLLFPLTRKFYANITRAYFNKKFQTGQWQFSTYSPYEQDNSGDETNRPQEIDE